MLRRAYEKLFPLDGDSGHSTEETQQEARSAVERSGADLLAASDKDPHINELVSQLRSQLDRNHFAEMLQESMRRA